MHVVHDVVLVRGYLLPLEIVHVHFLAAAVVDTTEDVDMLREVERAVEEASVRHRAELDELHRLEVEHHRVLRPSRVVVSAKNNDLVVRDEGGCLRLDRERELDR